MLTGIHCVLQDYIQSIGSCLLQIGEATDGPVVDMMHKLTDESSQLLGCIKLLNLKVHEAMLHGKLDPALAKTQSMAHYYASSVVGLLATSLRHLFASFFWSPLPCSARVSAALLALVAFVLLQIDSALIWAHLYASSITRHSILFAGVLALCPHLLMGFYLFVALCLGCSTQPHCNSALVHQLDANAMLL